LISRMGVLISLLSGLGALWVVWVRVFQPERTVPGWAFIMVGMFLLGGIQLLMMGVIGSYLGRVYVETQGRPLYSLALMARGQDHQFDAPRLAAPHPEQLMEPFAEPLVQTYKETQP
jgi:polyisoprenyl-phosphate glycosyltransferase